LYRHRRTHETSQDGQPQTSFSDEDLNGDEHGLASLEDDSSPDEQFFPSTMVNMASVTSMTTSMPAPSSLIMQSDMPSMPHSSQMMQPQMLQQHL
jgi:transcription factor STE12